MVCVCLDCFQHSNMDSIPIVVRSLIDVLGSIIKGAQVPEMSLEYILEININTFSDRSTMPQRQFVQLLFSFSSECSLVRPIIPLLLGLYCAVK